MNVNDGEICNMKYCGMKMGLNKIMIERYRFDLRCYFKSEVW